MSTHESVITSKGQMTVPKSIRDELHLSAGTKVTFTKNRDGYYELHANTVDVKTLKGFMARIRSVEKAATLAEMDESIAQAAARGVGEP